LDQQAYRKLISGASRGFGQTLLRLFLRLISCFYSAAIWLRNLMYARGLLKQHSVNAVVISIGNITVGGTGKTPLVVWVCNLLARKGVNCAILTRGYKIKKSKLSGEPAILTRGCPAANIIVNPDRVAAAAEAIAKFGAEVLVMDDGFQHRRLVRDLDIITIDAMLPFGYDKLLPAGLLRESLKALKRTDAAVITRCNQVSNLKLAQIEQKLKFINPHLAIAKSIHQPICAKTIDEEISVEGLKDKKIFAFCGIGNPAAFSKTIEQLGCQLAGSKIYDDHYHYSSNDIADICERAEDAEADLILTTQKDWTKITSGCGFAISAGQSPVLFAYLAIELRFVSGEEKIRRLIENVLAGTISGK